MGVNQANMHAKMQGETSEHCEPIQEENKFERKRRRQLSSAGGGQLSGQSEGRTYEGSAAGKSRKIVPVA